MNSNIKSLLTYHGFNRDKNLPVYYNLYNSLKKAIVNKTLSPHHKLPSSRVLAKDLEVSRSTVIKAYELLLIENFVTSKKGSGYYIKLRTNNKKTTKLNADPKKIEYPSLSQKGIAFKNVGTIKKRENQGIAFRPGLPPLDLFPVNTWKKLTANYWKSIKPSELSYSYSQGLPCLRYNISHYLKVYRNISCNADQVVITSGSLHSLYLISSILIDKNDEVVVENPTYPHAYRLFKSLEAVVKAVDIDEDGLNLTSIKSRRPKLIYTTPSCQYPLGVKMSMTRRFELLQWASRKNAVIVEDDYDHEFSNWEKPFSSLHSLDDQQRVVYLGTFNKLLHPSLRLGYMIVPYHFLDAVIALNEQSNRFIATSLQKPMSDFIEMGHLNKHLRNVIEVTNERKQKFIRLFKENLNPLQLFNYESTGLQLISDVPQNLNDISLSEYLKKENIVAHPLSQYYLNGNKKNGLVMGYSSVNVKLIKDNILKMRRMVKDFQKQQTSA